MQRVALQVNIGTWTQCMQITVRIFQKLCYMCFDIKVIGYAETRLKYYLLEKEKSAIRFSMVSLSTRINVSRNWQEAVL